MTTTTGDWRKDAKIKQKAEADAQLYREYMKKCSEMVKRAQDHWEKVQVVFDRKNLSHIRLWEFANLMERDRAKPELAARWAAAYARCLGQDVKDPVSPLPPNRIEKTREEADNWFDD